MLFNSFQFIWLFPIIFLLYYGWMWIFRKTNHSKWSNILLLLISYALYMQWSIQYTFILMGVTLTTYFGALMVEGNRTHRKKIIFGWLLILSLVPLGVFKYYDFIGRQVGNMLEAFNIATEIKGLNWILPVGISFYTFQAIGYFIDVYKGNIKAERNICDYMLFVSFFPQIMSGPISRAEDLLPQIKQNRRFDYTQALDGCKCLLWGFFLKTVLADRLGTAVDAILPNYAHFSGITCAVGAVLYSIQIYGDFAGYSLMAVGVGKLMGFNLINNFNRPYFSATITEFWKRWHISLTRWLTRYIYISLGGSRCSKFKTYRNIMVTFLVSGLWHGANWTFIFWGAIHGIVQVLEKALGIQQSKKNWYRPLRILFTFILVTLLWVFFYVPTIQDGFLLIGKMFLSPGNFDLAMANTDRFLIIFAVSVVFVREWFNEYHPNISLMNNRHLFVRWFTYIAICVVIMLCGVFDSSSFIYVSF